MQLRVDELERFASSNVERLRQQGADLGRAVADRLATFAAIIGGLHARQGGSEMATAAVAEEGVGRWEALAATMPAPIALTRRVSLSSLHISSVYKDFIKN
jgi:hypothetical protein